MEAPLPEPVLKERNQGRPKHCYKGIGDKLKEREHVKRRGDRDSKRNFPFALYIRIVSSGTNDGILISS